MRKTNPPKSNQDAFNRAWDRLIRRFSQGQCAKQYQCLYFYQGNNCVIGDMLPDNTCKYIDRVARNSDNISSISQVCSRHPSVKDFFKNVDISLLEELQGIHDADLSKVETKHILLSLASKYKLSVPK